MIEPGMILYFAPPMFSDGVTNIDKQKRLMLVIEKNNYDNTLMLLNISKIDGKPSCLTYKYNIAIRNFNPPLPVASFVKLNSNYKIDNFPELSNYLYKNGVLLNDEELKNIKEKYNQYKFNSIVHRISITKEEFMSCN